MSMPMRAALWLLLLVALPASMTALGRATPGVASAPGGVLESIAARLPHAAAPAAAAPQDEQQEEFIPIDELPPEERLPAAPLLVGAYAFVLVTLFVYLASVARRLTGIEQEIRRLEHEIGQPDQR